MILLHDIPFNLFHPSDWTVGQAGNAINFFVALAAAIAIWWSYKQSKDNKNDITSLTNALNGQVAEMKNQVAELKEQNNLQKLIMRAEYHPKLEIPNKPTYSVPIQLELHSVKKRAVIYKIEVSENFRVVEPDLTNSVLTLDTGEKQIIMVEPNLQRDGKLIMNENISMDFTARIRYVDTYHNPYFIDVKGGVGKVPEITQVREIPEEPSSTNNHSTVTPNP